MAVEGTLLSIRTHTLKQNTLGQSFTNKQLGVLEESTHKVIMSISTHVAVVNVTAV